MRNLKLIFATYCCILSFFVSSCSEQGDCLHEIEDHSDDLVKTCSLNFDITLQNAYSSSVTRSNSDWKDGDKIYLTFGESAYGTAEFLSGSWVLSYYGGLTTNESGTCLVYFFDSSVSDDSSIVKLNNNTALFKSVDGEYSYNGTTIYITAHLKPAVGRIRFAGMPESKISVMGITTYSTYSVAQNIFTYDNAPITLTIQSDGYSPYIYGFFSSHEAPILNILTDESGFNCKCPKSILGAGESGWMDVPTLKSHKGWANNLYFEVNKVGFTMIPVVYKSSVFCLAETELTEALYNAVNDLSDITSYYPHEFKYLSYGDEAHRQISDFLIKIKSKLSLNFRCPDMGEWLYAAKGGELSHSYRYSGSNDISEVAWYSSNSGGVVHEVAQLMPNELGFYDMSGNLREYIPYNNSPRLCGGCYNYPASECEIYSEEKYSSNYSFEGQIALRLALSID